jgi:hypothetical protein
MPALATGFGPLTMEDFATALKQALARDWAPLELVKVVLKNADDVETVRAIVN